MAREYTAAVPIRQFALGMLLIGVPLLIAELWLLSRWF
jgi:hypothetical protein